MKVEFINPFLDAVLNVLSTMAQTEASPENPFVKDHDGAMGDVTGMIGMVGEQTRGSMAISFTESAILHVASQMLGEKLERIDETVSDMVGEITNMVTGGAKKLLAEQGYTFDMAIPTTVVGKNHTIRHKTVGPAVIVPFKTSAGNFFIEICFEP
jgi:chemotaxis protein CheX